MNTYQTLITCNATYNLYNDLLIVRNNGFTQDYSKARSNLKKVGEFLNGRKVRILMNHEGFKSYGRDFRKTLYRNLNVCCTAFAVVAKTSEQLGVGSVTVSLSEGSFLTRIFKNEKDALDWLNSEEVTGCDFREIYA